MKDYMEQRALDIAQYIIDSGATVRTAAQVFKISKSTVHKDLSIKLKYINLNLYNDVKKILDLNKAERHLRGGAATKKKYQSKNRN